jgi:hypothetical protein
MDPDEVGRIAVVAHAGCATDAYALRGFVP